MIKKDISFAIIGGDLRQIRLMNTLVSEGYNVNAYGFNNAKYECFANICDDLKEALKNVDIVIGPIPCSQDNKTLYAKYSNKEVYLEDIFKNINNSIFMAGKITEDISRMCNHYNFKIIDLLNREELAILNAIPTAEGAIQIAMQNSEITIDGSNSIVLGFGRCGKVLADKLNGLGANVSVEARKDKDLAYIRSYGYRAIHLRNLEKDIGKYDFIFNTIPSLIIDKKMLQKLNKEVLIIDIASRPGGVDYYNAKKLGINALLCLSLPGKVAPKTAAGIIKDTIFNVYSEMGVII